MTKASTGSVGMWVFLVSDVFSFFALLVTYGVLRLQSPGWQTPGEPGLLLPAAFGLTIALALSSVTFAMAQRALKKAGASDEQARVKTASWLLLTLLLGTAFLVGQLVEYRLLWRAGLTLQSGLAGGSFYVITGFHALHVVAGLVVIATMLGRALQGRLDEASLAVSGLYWHFVDGVWIAIVAAVYLVSWSGLLLALVGLGLFFVTQLRRAALPMRMGVLLPLALPALYALGLLYEAWTRGTV